MVKKELVDWIKVEQSKGFTEEQIKDTLMKQGYKHIDVDEAIEQSHLGETSITVFALVAEKGTLFSVLFYILFGLFCVQLLGTLVTSIITQNLLLMISPVLFGLYFFVHFKKFTLYKLLIFLFMFYPFGFQLLMVLPLVRAFVDVNNSYFYYFIVVISLSFGLICAYMLNKATDSFKKYMKVGFLFSTLVAVIFSMTSMISTVISLLSEQIKIISETYLGESPLSGITDLFSGEIINSNIGFALAMFFYNAPFFMFIFHKKEKKWFYLLWYLVPIFVFVLGSLLLNSLIENIVSEITREIPV